MAVLAGAPRKVSALSLAPSVAGRTRSPAGGCPAAGCVWHSPNSVTRLKNGGGLHILLGSVLTGSLFP